MAVNSQVSHRGGTVGEAGATALGPIEARLAVLEADPPNTVPQAVVDAAVANAIAERGPGSHKLRVFATAALRDAEVTRLASAGESADGMLAVTVTGSWTERVSGAWVVRTKASVMARIDHAFGEPAQADVESLLAAGGRLVPYDELGPAA